MHSFKYWLAYNKKKILFLGLVFISQWTQAIVNIDRTRVIIPTDKISTSFNIINEATDKPALVQIWVDEGDPTIVPEEIKSPVIVIDPIFRLEPNEQRNVKLLLPDSSKVAADKESVYWLNILQIPAVEKIQSGQQRVVLPLRLRVKLFVRPAKVPAPTEADMLKLEFYQKGTKLQIKNPTPWNITLVGLHSDQVKFNDAMILAKSELLLELEQPLKTDALIEFSTINDQGTQWPVKMKIK